MEKIDIDFEIVPNYLGLLDPESRELSPFKSIGYGRLKVESHNYNKEQRLLFQNTSAVNGKPVWELIKYIGFFLSENPEELPLTQKYPEAGIPDAIVLWRGDALQLNVTFQLRLVTFG